MISVEDNNFADLHWSNYSTCYSDVQYNSAPAYCEVWCYRAPFDVTLRHPSEMLSGVKKRLEKSLKLSTKEGGKTLIFSVVLHHSFDLWP